MAAVFNFECPIIQIVTNQPHFCSVQKIFFWSAVLPCVHKSIGDIIADLNYHRSVKGAEHICQNSSALTVHSTCCLRKSITKAQIPKIFGNFTHYLTYSRPLSYALLFPYPMYSTSTMNIAHVQYFAIHFHFHSLHEVKQIFLLDIAQISTCTRVYKNLNCLHS